MAVYKLIVLGPAITEFEEGIVFYKSRLEGLEFEFEDEIFILLELIKNNPFLFPVKFAHIREAVVKRFPYVINYEVTEKNQIIVSAIFQTQQHPNKKIKRKRK